MRRGSRGEAADDRVRQPIPVGLEGAHLGQQGFGRGTLRRVLGQAALDQRPHRGRHLVKAGRFMRDAVQQRRRRPGAERSLAGGGEHEHRPQAEDVALRSSLAAQSLLGGHEPGRSGHQVGLGQRGGFRRAGDAEVDHPRPVLRQQHVRRLEILVDHSRGVDRRQALRQARGQRQQRPLRQWPVTVHRLVQRRPRHVRCGQPRHRPADVPRPPPSRVNTPLTRRTAATSRPNRTRNCGIRGQLGADDLHRYRPPARRHAQVHLPHTTAPEPPNQPVRADGLRIPGQ